jgi:hypothetical protein
MSRRKAMTASCGHTDRGPKPRKDWSAVVGRCGPGERARIEKGRGRYFASLMWRFENQVGQAVDG